MRKKHQIVENRLVDEPLIDENIINQQISQSVKKLKYRVFFYCPRCSLVFSEKSNEIIAAAMKIDLNGCPKCHMALGVKLTHHEEIKTEAQDEIDLTEFIRVVAFNNEDEDDE